MDRSTLQANAGALVAGRSWSEHLADAHRTITTAETARHRLRAKLRNVAGLFGETLFRALEEPVELYEEHVSDLTTEFGRAVEGLCHEVDSLRVAETRARQDAGRFRDALGQAVDELERRLKRSGAHRASPDLLVLLAELHEVLDEPTEPF